MTIAAGSWARFRSSRSKRFLYAHMRTSVVRGNTRVHAMNDPAGRSAINLLAPSLFMDRRTSNLGQIASPRAPMLEPGQVESCLLKTLAQLRQVEMREKVFAFSQQCFVFSFAPGISVRRLHLEENWDHPLTSCCVIDSLRNLEVYAVLRL